MQGKDNEGRKKHGRERFKFQQPQRAVGVHDINELLSLQVRDNWTKSPNVLKTPGCALPAKTEHSTELCTQRVSLLQQHLTRTWGSPQAEAKPVVSMKPAFTHGRDTTLPLITAKICNKWKPAMVTSQSRCLLEWKKSSSLCKKDLKTELRTFSTS